MTNDALLDNLGAFVCHEMGVTERDIVSTRREDIPARALFVWLAKTVGGDAMTFSAIGRWLGDRDHVTIANLYRTVAPRLHASDQRFRALCDRFTQKETVQ